MTDGFQTSAQLTPAQIEARLLSMTPDLVATLRQLIGAPAPPAGLAIAFSAYPGDLPPLLSQSPTADQRAVRTLLLR